jgi:hypothetical protein
MQDENERQNKDDGPWRRVEERGEQRARGRERLSESLSYTVGHSFELKGNRLRAHWPDGGSDRLDLLLGQAEA